MLTIKVDLSLTMVISIVLLGVRQLMMIAANLLVIHPIRLTEAPVA